MDQFIARENVKHFRRELENGADGQRRETLIRLLVEEENHLGLTREQLSRLDRHIAHLSEIMARQVELIDNIKSLDVPTERAQIMLATLNDLMAEQEIIGMGRQGCAGARRRRIGAADCGGSRANHVSGGPTRPWR